MPSNSGTVYINEKEGSSDKTRSGFFVDKPPRTENSRHFRSLRSTGLFIPPQKTKAKKPQKNRKKSKKDEGLSSLVKRSNLVIFEATSLFPVFSRFKNKIAITCNRVTVSQSGFFTKSEYPMPIENVTGARVYRDFMFGTLYIDTFGIEKPDPIKFLRSTDARLARRYILALKECVKANIKLPLDDIDELREMLKNIGMVRISASDVDDKYHNI